MNSKRMCTGLPDEQKNTTEKGHSAEDCSRTCWSLKDLSETCNGVEHCTFGHREWRKNVHEQVHVAVHHVYRIRAA